MSDESGNASELLTTSSSLPPGAGLVASNAQDITRKGSKKSKHHILMVLPTQVAFRKSDIDYELGVLEHANTSEPTFLVKTERGTLRYPGRYVSTSSAIFMIEIFSKSQQSVVSEMYQQLLVFDAPILSPAIALDRSPLDTEVNSARSSGSVNTEVKEYTSEISESWCRYQGVSTIADRFLHAGGRTEIGTHSPSSTDEGLHGDESNDYARSKRSRRQIIHTKITSVNHADSDHDSEVHEEPERPLPRREKRNTRVRKADSDTTAASSSESGSDCDSATDDSSDYEEPTKRKRKSA